MKLAFTMAPGRGDTDMLLRAAAQGLAERGYRTCGTVQINTDRGAHPCDMDVRVLPDGPVLRISQNLGAGSKGCRLDPAVLETAVGLVSNRLESGADALIINKFGKHEAEGRGFRTPIAEAIARDIPVLVGVNALNLEAFRAFAGPDTVQVAPDLDTVLAWLLDAIAPKAEAAVEAHACL